MPKITKALKRLITTEKTTKLKEGQNQYVFEVALKASASKIAREVETEYKVEVVDVKTAVIPGKKRRLFRTQRFIRLPKWKKAVVKLKEGHKIEEAKVDKTKNKEADKKSEGKEAK